MSQKEEEINNENEPKKERDNSINKNEVDNTSYSYNTPKSSYGNTYPSPFSSKESKSHSKSDYSNSKKSYHRSRSNSYRKSKSRSHSKSYSKRSSRSYHDKPRSIPQVFITRLSYYVTKRDLEKEFIRFGDIKNLTLKKGYAFVEFYDPKDAKYAIKELDGRKLFGQSNRVVVEEAKISREEREKEKSKKRSKSRDKEKNRDDNKDKYKDRDYYYKRRSGPKKTDICYNCGKEGHWANECHENRGER